MGLKFFWAIEMDVFFCVSSPRGEGLQIYRRSEVPISMAMVAMVGKPSRVAHIPVIGRSHISSFLSIPRQCKVRKIERLVQQSLGFLAHSCIYIYMGGSIVMGVAPKLDGLQWKTYL